MKYASATGKLEDAHPQMISEPEVEAALDWLRDNAQAIGAAKERMVKAGHMLRHIEAIEFKMAEGSMEFRKAHARSTERYVEAINEDAIAAGEYQRMLALREAAALKIEVWRSASANYRSMKL